jgi:hypothetical protein
MDNTLTYILDLQDKVSGKLKKIGIANDEQLSKWAEVQTKVVAAANTMNKMGESIGSLTERVSALRAQKEWIPASNREAIRATNHEITRLEGEITKLNNLDGGKIKRWFKELTDAVPGLNLIRNPIVAITAAGYKLNQYIGASKQAYMEESVEVEKLSTVMRNTMGARREEVDAILDLTSAQQKLGVIGDEVQMSGAQELATYLQYPDSLKKILPAMNDMLAQQYGLNASQEQAQQIATMLGKVMQGQTGALSRYGYGFTEAQEKILKTGTEAERTAVLFDVVSESVGGVNAALAKMPEGKLRQQANNMGDLQERVGRLSVLAESAFSPVVARVGEMMDGIISFFEKNSEKILRLTRFVTDAVLGALDAVWRALKGVWSLFAGFAEGVRQGNVVFTGLAVAIGIVTSAIVVYNTYMAAAAAVSKTLAFFKGIETAAWWANNAAMYANPVMLIIAGVIALIAVIVYLCYKIEGWGSLWDGVVGFMKNSFHAFVEGIKLYWSTLVNGIMIGLNKIMLGWYKFKEAVGLGDSPENQSAIARINADVEKRQKAVTEGANRVAEYARKAGASLSGIEMSWNSDKSLSDVTGGIKSKLGIGANAGLQTAVNGPLASLNGGVGSRSNGGVGGRNVAGSNEAIASGGTRNTTVHISIGKFFESMIFNGGVRENREDVQRQMAEVMARVLGMAETSN